ncbi:MAG: EAL domain-containing protein, partial [Arcobacteraceae bacterium]|nr:EAL domain-containing protein [Arcobacteraceae bacterium]
SGFFDKNGDLLILNRSINDQTIQCFSSYDTNGKQIFKDINTQEIINKPFYENIDINSINNFSSVYHNNTYILQYTSKIISNGNHIGYIRIGYHINDLFVTTLQELLSNQILFQTHTLENIYSKDFNIEILNQHQKYDINKVKIADTNLNLYALIITNKVIIQNILYNSFKDAILFLFIIFIVVVTLSFRFISKYIITPISKLKTGIEAIKENKYTHIQCNHNDEICDIINDFNLLSKILIQNLIFLESYKSAIDDHGIVSKADLKGTIIYANNNFCKLSGYLLDEIIGKNHNIVRHPDTQKSVFRNMWKTIQNKQTWKGVIKNKKKDGGYYWVDQVIKPILDENNNIIEYLAIRHNITEIIEQRKQLELSANTDSLTELSNRFKLHNNIEQAHHQLSLVVLNIDQFREINDFYGHYFGDRLILAVANKLNLIIKKYKNIELYRLQGDEFVILGYDYNHQVLISDIKKILKIIKTTTFEIDDEKVNIVCTCGISFENKNILLSTADMALQVAKKQHQDLIIYSEGISLNKEYENNIKWTNKLKEAIRNDKIVTYYQPIVNNSNKNYEKYECLVRMIDNDGQIISPFFFLDIAKKTKQYLDITRTVIRQSFEMFKDKDVEFSINLSINDIFEPSICQYIIDMLQKYNIGHKVVFEIVETESIQNFEEVQNFINKVREFNCKIAIDDFGTGYSNFEYLVKLKADYLKIDGSLIKNIKTDKNSQIVITTLVEFSKRLDMKVIAEFVEDEDIFIMVKDFGIDYSQGYYFSRPIDKPLL